MAGFAVGRLGRPRDGSLFRPRRGARFAVSGPARYDSEPLAVCLFGPRQTNWSAEPLRLGPGVAVVGVDAAGTPPSP